jgi:hypothetical protein
MEESANSRVDTTVSCQPMSDRAPSAQPIGEDFGDTALSEQPMRDDLRVTVTTEQQEEEEGRSKQDWGSNIIGQTEVMNRLHPGNLCIGVYQEELDTVSPGGISICLQPPSDVSSYSLHSGDLSAASPLPGLHPEGLSRTSSLQTGELSASLQTGDLSASLYSSGDHCLRPEDLQWRGRRTSDRR